MHSDAPGAGGGHTETPARHHRQRRQHIQAANVLPNKQSRHFHGQRASQDGRQDWGKRVVSPPEWEIAEGDLDCKRRCYIRDVHS